MKPIPTITGAVKKGSELMVDWSNGVKMTITLEDLGDCHLVGSLPWDSEGSVSSTDCNKDDIILVIQSQFYGNWTVEAKNTLI